MFTNNQASHIKYIYQDMQIFPITDPSQDTQHNINSSLWTKKLICNWYFQCNDQILAISYVK